MAGLSNPITVLAKRCRKQLWALMALIVTFGPLSMDATGQDVGDMEGFLVLRTDGPAVLDAPIMITAVLRNADDFRSPFYFSFSKLQKYNMSHRLTLAWVYMRP